MSRLVPPPAVLARLLRQFQGKLLPNPSGSSPLPARGAYSSASPASICHSFHHTSCSPRSRPISRASTPVLSRTPPSPTQQRIRTKRRYSSSPPEPEKRDSKVKFWPFFAIIGAGSLAYYKLAQTRHEAAQEATTKHRPQSSIFFPVAPISQTHPSPATTTKQTMAPVPAPAPTAFSPKDVTVIFVLGGPGAGKGTQSALLVSEYAFVHLSAGDLLRAEQSRPGSQFGDLIKRCIAEGEIVPMEVTIKLLENAMREHLLSQCPNPNPTTTAAEGDEAAKVAGVKGKFLIDGFPRKMDQALKFEESVCPAQFVLFYDCPETELEKRLLERGKTSGRADDNPDSIRKRFHTFVETSMPVVDVFEKEGRVVRVLATKSIDDVFEETRVQLKERLGDAL